MAEVRTPRDLTSRDQVARKKSWSRPELLPTPNPEPGYDFHWVRISTLGVSDAMNVSSKLREGWEPVKAADHPEVFMPMTEDQRFKDNVVVGGLMLCKTPSEFVAERNAYYTGQADSQIKSVDNNFMRESDARMPLFNERKTKVTFGNGS